MSDLARRDSRIDAAQENAAQAYVDRVLPDGTEHERNILFLGFCEGWSKGIEQARRDWRVDGF